MQYPAGKLGCWNSSGYHFNTYHTQRCCKWHPQCTPTKKKSTTAKGGLALPLSFTDPNPIIYSRCQNKPDPWRPRSAPCKTQRNCSHWLSTRRYPGRSDLFLQQDLHNIKQAVLNTRPWNMRPWEGNTLPISNGPLRKKRPRNNVSNHSLFYNIYSNVHAMCTILSLESTNAMQCAWMSQSYWKMTLARHATSLQVKVIKLFVKLFILMLKGRKNVSTLRHVDKSKAGLAFAP